jgi:hypothetical protein
MLEQAIVDAKALREAALKNAEQTIIEKYAPEIKEAVNSLLENEPGDIPRGTRVKYEGQIYEVVSDPDGGRIAIQKEGEKAQLVLESDLQEVTEEDLLQEEEMGVSMAGSAPDPSVQFPTANSADRETPVEMSYTQEDDGKLFDINLDALKQEMASSPNDPMMEPEGPTDILGDLGIPNEEEIDLGGEEEEGLPELGGDEDYKLQEDLMNEITNLLSEIDEEDDDDEEILEEELIVDMGMVKDGTYQTDEATLAYKRDMELAKRESTQYKEEMEVLEKKMKELKENYKKLQNKNKQYKDVVEKINEKFNETLLSNAKLLYSNKTLSDASLNERQKTKIVEAIAKAKTPEEAKALCEALNATVTSGNDKKHGPRTLSESVQRKSNLSGILPRRNKPVSNEKHTFAEHMKKLAGIK